MFLQNFLQTKSYQLQIEKFYLFLTLSTEINHKYDDIGRLKVKRWIKIYHENINQKRKSDNMNIR